MELEIGASMEEENIVNGSGVLSDVGGGAQCIEEANETQIIVSYSCNEQSEPCEPAAGIIFPLVDAVKSFYRQYAKAKGFDFIIRNSRKGDDGELKYFILACSQEGSCVSTVPNDLNTYPTIKKNCQAKITVGLNKNGLWCIKKAVLDHSHDLSPAKARMFQGNKNISMHVKRRIEINNEAGVRLNKTFRSLVHDVGGYANLPFVERDVKNYVGRERRTIGKEGDGKALRSYFSRMQQQNSHFFYSIDLDDDFHVKNVFWADARSRAAYESFGDVVMFDTTYLTNRYDMPFAPFVGVNHHGQSILLGCGLLSTEDADSFVWLFESWLNCMSGKAPNGIITDQCMAMKSAIQIVFPTTLHRWCLWHIMKKIPEKLKGYGEYNSIKDAMKNAVYDSLTEAEFEEKWVTFVQQHDLQDNEWLSGLYNERQRWVPIFLKKDFWAGMSTTQRSESINAFFDGYINSSTTLQVFVRQYDNALHYKAKKEYEADSRSFNSIIACGSNSMIERQFQGEYTHSKFAEVQAEFRGKMNCSICIKCVEDGISTYDVLEEMVVVGCMKERTVEVVFNRNNHDVRCKCLLFEFKSIVCRHSLAVLAQERVKEMPSKYILPRWSKNIRRKHAYIKSSYDVKQLQPQMQRFDNLLKEFYEVAEVAAECDNASDFFLQTLRACKSKVQSIATSNHNNVICHKGQHKTGNMIGTGSSQTKELSSEIHSPLRVARKGRPRSNRKVSTVDQIVRKKRKTTLQRSHMLTIDECIEGSMSQINGNKLHVCSSMEIMTPGERDDDCTVSTAVDLNTNVDDYNDSCWTSQLVESPAQSLWGNCRITYNGCKD